MTEPRIDNQMLDLLYGESDEETRARLLDEMGSDDKETLDELKQLRSAFADLTEDDELGSVARANILREARLTAAERKEKREKAAAFPWFPAFALGALALLIGVGTYLFLYRPPATEPGEERRSDEVVATGTEPGEDEMARNLDTPAEAAPEEMPASAAEDPEMAEAPAEAEADQADRQAAADLTQKEQETQPAVSPENQGQTGKNLAQRSRTDNRERRAEAPKKNAPTKKAAPPAWDTEQSKSGEAPQSIATNRANSATSGAASGSGDYGVEIDDMGPDASSLQRGVANYEAGNYDEAVASLTAALSAGTDRKTALFYRGLANQRLNKHIDAIADFREVVEKHGSWARTPEAELALADSMVAVGNPTGAAEHYQAVADGDSGQADTARERMKNLQTAPGGGVDQNGSKATARDEEKKKRSRKKKSTDDSKQRKKAMEKDDAFEPAESKGSIVY